MSAQILLIGLSFLATLFTIIGVFFAYIIIFRKIPEPNKPLSKKFLVFLLSLICIIFFAIAAMCSAGVVDVIKYLYK